MNNQIAVKLNKACKYAFMQLHNAFGFDFEKPFTMVYHEGNFTIASARKLLGVEYDDFIIIIRNPENYCRRDRFMVVKAIGGGFDLVEGRTLGYYNNYRQSLDDYFRKSDFNEDRKSKTAQVFLFYQAKEYRHPKKTSSFDSSKRYKVGKVTKGSYNGTEYASQVELMPLDDNGHRFTWHPCGERTFYAGNLKTLENCIDKSGYILTERRSDLECRAKALRRERERAAYLKTDDTAKAQELEKKFAATKAAIISELEKATTSEEFDKVGKKIDGWHGLRWIIGDINRYKAKTAARDYASIEDANKAYNEIASGLEALTKEAK